MAHTVVEAWQGRAAAGSRRTSSIKIKQRILCIENTSFTFVLYNEDDMNA